MVRVQELEVVKRMVAAHKRLKELREESIKKSKEWYNEQRRSAGQGK